VKKKMKVAVMANGEWDVTWGQEALAKTQIDMLICADGGANHAISSGSIPHVLIGDLDSITADNLSICQSEKTEIIQYPREKDQTDLELAVEYAHSYLQSCGQSEDQIMLYGAGGKRLDHLLGNIALMLGYAQRQRTVKMIDKNHQAWIMPPGTQVVHGAKGQELSIIPLSEKATVSSKGLYYELNNLTLFQNAARGMSNVFRNNQATIDVHDGMIMVIVLVDTN